MPRLCRDCQQKLTRIRRPLWMRCIPGSQHYLCRKCGYSYLLIFNRRLLKRRRLLYTPGWPVRFWIP
jgi:predicted amidophosphoribosyltransferase